MTTKLALKRELRAARRDIVELGVALGLTPAASLVHIDTPRHTILERMLRKLTKAVIHEGPEVAQKIAREALDLVGPEPPLSVHQDRVTRALEALR